MWIRYKYLLKAWLVVVRVLRHQGLDRDEDRGDALSRAPRWPCPCAEYQMHGNEKSGLNFRQPDFKVPKQACFNCMLVCHLKNDLQPVLLTYKCNKSWVCFPKPTIQTACIVPESTSVALLLFIFKNKNKQKNKNKTHAPPLEYFKCILYRYYCFKSFFLK